MELAQNRELILLEKFFTLYDAEDDDPKEMDATYKQLSKEGGYLSPPLRALDCVWKRHFLHGSLGGAERFLLDDIKRRTKFLERHPDFVGKRCSHDYVLLQLAVLIADEQLQKRVARAVVYWTDDSEDHPYFPAFTGMLRAHVLSDMASFEKQMEVLLGVSPFKLYIWAHKPLLKAFAAGDAKKCGKLVNKYAEEHWRYSIAERAAVVNTAEQLTVDVSARHPHFRWPWLQACIAKRMVASGMEFHSTSSWLPPSLFAS